MELLNFNLYEFLSKISGCSFRERFHLYCPGCGGTRAFISLIHGNIIESLIYNPLLIIFVGGYSVCIFTFIYELTKSKTGKFASLRIKTSIFVIIATLVVFAYRNILLILGIDILGNFS